MNNPTDHKELLRRARDIIDTPQDGLEDWVIAPTRHAERYQSEASGLSEILASADITVTATQYEESDRDASEAKSRFTKAASKANLAVFITASLGASLLVANGFRIPEGYQHYQTWVLQTLGGLSLIVGAMGGWWLFQIQHGKLLEEWMTRRAKAETYRVRLFELATGAPESAGSTEEIPLPLLQLEYFRRYQLDVQIAFYRDASARHAQAARRTLAIGGVAIVLGTLATGIGGVIPGFAAFAGLGVIGVALSSYSATKEGISHDRRNAERYERSRDALREIKKELDGVRRDVLENHREQLNTFVATVHDQISLEHRQWLSATQAAAKTVGGLQEPTARG